MAKAGDSKSARLICKTAGGEDYDRASQPPIMSRDSALRRVNILVAEDDEDDFYFLKHMLRKIPFASVYRVSDGEEAINFLQGKGPFAKRSAFPLPDIFLVDLKLPKISGHEVLEWLQGRKKPENLRICVLSVSDSAADRARARKAGAHDYFVKPLSLGHLAALFTLPVETEAKLGA
jgi:DNA-binding response OmpR family regulator